MSAADAVDALRRGHAMGDSRAKRGIPAAASAKSLRPRHAADESACGRAGYPLSLRQHHRSAASFALLRSSRSSATKASAAPTQMNTSAGLNTAKRTKVGSMKSMTEP